MVVDRTRAIALVKSRYPDAGADQLVPNDWGPAWLFDTGAGMGDDGVLVDKSDGYFLPLPSGLSTPFKSAYELGLRFSRCRFVVSDIVDRKRSVEVLHDLALRYPGIDYRPFDEGVVLMVRTA